MKLFLLIMLASIGRYFRMLSFMFWQSSGTPRGNSPINGLYLQAGGIITVQKCMRYYKNIYISSFCEDIVLLGRHTADPGLEFLDRISYCRNKVTEPEVWRGCGWLSWRANLSPEQCQLFCTASCLIPNQFISTRLEHGLYAGCIITHSSLFANCKYPLFFYIDFAKSFVIFNKLS